MNEWEKLFAQAKEKLIAAKALLANDQVDMKQVKALQDEAAALEERANALKASQAGIDRLSAGQLPAALPTSFGLSAIGSEGGCGIALSMGFLPLLSARSVLIAS